MPVVVREVSEYPQCQDGQLFCDDPLNPVFLNDTADNINYLLETGQKIGGGDATVSKSFSSNRAITYPCMGFIWHGSTITYHSLIRNYPITLIGGFDSYILDMVLKVSAWNAPLIMQNPQSRAGSIRISLLSESGVNVETIGHYFLDTAYYLANVGALPANAVQLPLAGKPNRVIITGTFPTPLGYYPPADKTKLGYIRFEFLHPELVNNSVIDDYFEADDRTKYTWDGLFSWNMKGTLS